MMKRLLSMLLVLATLLSLASPVFASEPETAQSEPTEEVTAVESTEPAEDLPETVESIPETTEETVPETTEETVPETMEETSPEITEETGREEEITPLETIVGSNQPITLGATTYTVSYNANGGSGAPGSQTKESGVDLTLSTTVPVRFGYTFLGWATSSTATSADYLPGGIYTANANRTLYAVWEEAIEIPSYTWGTGYSTDILFARGYQYYRFTPENGGYYTIYSVGELDPMIYVFDSDGDQIGFDDQSGDGNNFQLTMHLTAGETYYLRVMMWASGTGHIDFWLEIMNEIIYDANGGSGAPPSPQYTSAFYANATLSTVAPTRSGYSFVGWATSSTSTIAEYQPGETVPNMEMTLYAVWTTGSVYTITYDANGGRNAPYQQKKAYGATITLRTEAPERFGYNFLGWGTSSTATTPTYLPGDSYSSNTSRTLYAVWGAAEVLSSSLLSVSRTTDVAYEGLCGYYIITPTVDRKYCFESFSNYDTFISIYDSSQSQVAYNDDGGEDYNFRLVAELEAGVTYYIKVRMYGNSTGTIPFTVRRVYDITYNANGGSGVPEAQEKIYNEDLTLSTTAPTRSGYTFLGWSTSSVATTATYQPGGSFTSNGDYTLYAVWQAGTTSYTVTYNANGGTGAPSTQTKQHNVALTLSTTVPERMGYTFLGWATSSTATSAAYVPGGSYTGNANRTLYAVWQTATVISSGTTNASYTTTVDFGGKYEFFRFAPSSSGKYRFESSSSSDTRIFLYNSAGTQIAEDDDGGEGNNFLLTQTLTGGTTYYIRVRMFGSDITGSIPFTVKRVYDISYNANGGSGAPTAQEKVHGTSLTLSTTTPTRSGYTFLGWATSSTAASASYQPGGNFTSNGNYTLYAVWGSDSGYTISYNANGGSGAPASQTKQYNVALTLSTTVPERMGYTFLGWATSSTATSAAYVPGGSYTGNANQTLYAVWQSATVISSGTTNASYTTTVDFGGKYEFFRFAPSSSGKYRFESSSSSDTRIFLYNSAGTQIASDDDGGTGNNFLLTQELTGGTAYYIRVRMYSGSTTGTIPFTVRRVYDISYNANGGSGAPTAQEKVHGTSLTLSSVTPARSGYTFLGWATSSTAASASYQPGGSYTSNSSCTLYAVWRSDTSYTISYNANGGSGAPGSQTKTHGVALTLSSTVPTRSGYTFLGWNTASNGSGTSYASGASYTANASVTLYAQWEQGCADGHAYSYNVSSKPSTTGTGTLMGTCSKCSGTATVTVPKLDTTNYNYKVVTAATCTATGTGRYTWKNTSYGTYSFDAVLSKLSHSYSYSTTKEPTTDAAGSLTGTCSSCSATTTVTMPKLSTTDYTYKVTKEPLCTATGTGQYTWKNTSCGNFSFEVTLPKLKEHTYVPTIYDPTCENEGCTIYNCACTDSYVDTYVDALGHSYEETITKQPTATEPGEKTRRCTRCGDEKTEPIPATGVFEPDTSDEHECYVDVYTDVNLGAWYHSYLDYMVGNGFMNGKSDTSMDPDGNLTRAELVQILYKIVGAPSVAGQSEPFADVNASQWFCNAIIWAYNEGVVTGTSDTTFSPDEKITREQLATIMYRYSEEPPVSGNLNAFKDGGTVNSYAVNAMIWAVENGLVTGVTEDTLAPRPRFDGDDGNATRAQAATILTRYLSK